MWEHILYNIEKYTNYLINVLRDPNLNLILNQNAIE